MGNIRQRSKRGEDMDTKKTWEEFAATWKAVMGRPEEFFATWDPAEGWQKVIVFNVICGLIGGILTAVLTFFFGIGAIIRYPLSILAMTFVGGVILFLCFKLFGGVGGVEPTIKMMGYTQAVRVFPSASPSSVSPSVSWLPSIKYGSSSSAAGPSTVSTPPGRPSPSCCRLSSSASSPSSAPFSSGSP
jgi:hypothetical protein